MNRLRNQRGGAIAFGAVLALALVLLGVGFVLMSLYMGGQTETKNATDAGALNVGKQVLDNISVNLSGTDNQQCFMDITNDVTDNSQSDDGKINLRRINRMWAKAILMAINADAASNDGNVGTGSDNAASACQGAQTVSDELTSQLTTPSNLYTFFTDFAQRNSVRMLGNNATVNVLTGSNWQTSLMDRGDESNIVIAGSPPSFTLPPNYTLDGNYTTQCTRTPIPQGASGLWFFKGYTPITIGNQTFWQVPYQYDEKPFLVSQSMFDAAKPSAVPLSWQNAAPNAFSVAGAAVKAGPGEKAVSWVLTNPRQPFQLSMPHSFLHIKLDNMVSKWFFFPTGYPPIEFGPEQTYGYTTDDQTGVPMPAGGVLCSTVTPDDVEVGLDVVGRPLDQIIFGIPDGDTSKLEAYMVNRINEMIGNVGETKSASDLHSLLNDPATIGWMVAGEQDFYIFSPDGQNLTVQPKAMAIAKAPWIASMIDNDPDGQETQLIDDTWTPAPIFFEPIVTPDPFCSPFLELGWGTWDKSIYWTPGTGYNGSLGQIRVTRWTDVYSLGACNPF